jgi:uncharacterized protein (TIGR02118 family)
MTMLKIAWFARFAPGLTREQARRHWREVHGPLAAATPQLQRYVQNHAVQAVGPVEVLDEAPNFDGYSTGWYADADAYEASTHTPEWAAVGADSPNVFDNAWFAGMMAVVEERTIVDGPPGPYKVVWVMRFPEDVRTDPERRREAREYWIATHGGRYGAAVPGIVSYVQNHVVAGIGEDGIDEGLLPHFDGYSECWFADRAAFEEMVAQPEWLEMNKDAETLFDPGSNTAGMYAVLDETVVKG